MEANRSCTFKFLIPGKSCKFMLNRSIPSMFQIRLDTVLKRTFLCLFQEQNPGLSDHSHCPVLTELCWLLAYTPSSFASICMSSLYLVSVRCWFRVNSTTNKTLSIRPATTRISRLQLLPVAGSFLYSPPLCHQPLTLQTWRDGEAQLA